MLERSIVGWKGMNCLLDTNRLMRDNLSLRDKPNLAFTNTKK
jgi:hypothetical protein